MSKFALIIESAEAKSEYDNSVMTRTGEKMLVIEDPERWVEATSHYWHSNYNNSEGFPPFTKLFGSVEAATEFAKRWVGHPWYCKPNGNFEVIEVMPRYKQVLKGYEPVNLLKS
jgi:hypothetical protein